MGRSAPAWIVCKHSFKAELNNVCDVFTKEKLVHIPLKGSIIKNMYPSTDMRSMSDMDILIKREDEKEGA